MEPQVQPATATQPAPATKSPEQICIELRAKVTRGETLSRDEVREALAALRQNRLSAAEAPSKKKPTGPSRSASELLAALKKTPTQG